MFAGVNDNSWKGSLIFMPGYARGDRSVVCRFTLHAQAFPPGSESRPELIVGPLKIPGRTVGAERPSTPKRISHRTSGSTAPLPKSDEFDLLVKNNFVNYRLRVERAGRKSTGVLLCGTQGDTQARTDHQAFLHSGMVRRRQVGRRSHAPHSRHRQADSRGSLRGFLLVR